MSSYQVLARKWRPHDFDTIVGQEHVVTALTRALTEKRLHHAYLFTGTRGVGKTTISRIFAKALNCQGADGHGDMTAHPCGVCPACRAIDEGRFPDYIEMDAASNRSVEDMTALLERAMGNNEIKNWQQKGSEPYAKLQREIVDDAIKLIAPGGMLLYSTCTFSPEENEQVIEYLLEKNEDLSLVPMKMCEGFDHGHPEWTLTGREDIKQCIRLWPHKIKGEGHFLALLKKADGEQPTFKYEKIKKVKLTPETEEFFKNCKMDIDWSHVREHQGKLFYLKEDIPEMKKVRVLRKGLYLGEMKKGRFEPSQSFAVALAANEYEPYLSFDINDENTVKYLKCETLDVDTNTEGIHLVGTNEFPLGWAKIKKGRLKNKYSSSWRWL